MGTLLNRIADTALEATIVGSYSKAGFAARARLGDWSAPSGDLSGKRALVTGGSGGIGSEIAQGLMSLGAEAIVTSRSMETATKTAESLNDGPHDGHAEPMVVDTAEFDSINDLVNEVEARGPLDFLIHNAGALTADYSTNSRGMELTLASHLVGPYLLTKRLRSSLAVGAHVIWMSSGGMYTQKLDLDDLEMSESNYRGSVAYARAKRAMVEMVTHVAPDWAQEATISSMHPGWVDTPGVSTGIPLFHKLMAPTLRSAAQGADTMVWLAANTADVETGKFWLDRQPRPTSYLPVTRTDDAERTKLIDWLELQTLPGMVGGS